MNNKVAVAMSGGVDSSVAAALLVNQGFDVIGFFLRLWNEPGYEHENLCCTPEAMENVRCVCEILNIPFYVLDAREEFYASVIGGFIDGYAKGITPNPCLFCNRFIRWGFLIENIQYYSADFLATGHYARIISGEHATFELYKAADRTKDQSYVLYMLTQAQLSRTIFPLAEISKISVRQLAREYNLPVSDRQESQDLCFVGDGNYWDFLVRNAPHIQNPGKIINSDGDILGDHVGLAFYTIGQRKGLGLNSTQPLYVVEKDIINNVLIVGSKSDLEKMELIAQDVKWISGNPPEQSFKANIKIRYKSPDVSGNVTLLNQSLVRIRFSSPIIGITPGQAAVFYQGDQCIGGGIIRE